MMQQSSVHLAGIESEHINSVYLLSLIHVEKLKLNLTDYLVVKGKQ